MAPASHADAAALATDLSRSIEIVYVPLDGAVARLDTSTRPWVLRLDPGSPEEDHCWAMLDVAKILRWGVDAAEHAVLVRRLRLVPTQGADRPGPPARA